MIVPPARDGANLLVGTCWPPRVFYALIAYVYGPTLGRVGLLGIDHRPTAAAVISLERRFGQFWPMPDVIRISTWRRTNYYSIVDFGQCGFPEANTLNKLSAKTVCSKLQEELL